MTDFSELRKPSMRRDLRAPLSEPLLFRGVNLFKAEQWGGRAGGGGRAQSLKSRAPDFSLSLSITLQLSWASFLFSHWWHQISFWWQKEHLQLQVNLKMIICWQTGEGTLNKDGEGKHGQPPWLERKRHWRNHCDWFIRRYKAKSPREHHIRKYKRNTLKRLCPLHRPECC